MDELLHQLSEQLGVPVPLLERSARARAEKMGVTVDDVLREWIALVSGTEADATPPGPAAAPGRRGTGAAHRPVCRWFGCVCRR